MKISELSNFAGDVLKGTILIIVFFSVGTTCLILFTLFASDQFSKFLVAIPFNYTCVYSTLIAFLAWIKKKYQFPQTKTTQTQQPDTLQR